MRNKEEKHIEDRFHRAVATFKEQGGMLRTSDAIAKGIHPETLYTLRDTGILERISRGLYRLANNIPLSNPDLVTVSKRIPGGVICLISALVIHELTTQIPHEVYLALLRGAEQPRVGYPPIRVFRFTGISFTEGVEKHKMDDIPVNVYNREKTIADCFKFRNKIGLDTAIEALRLYREQQNIKINDLMHFAEICRVSNIIRPYMEALI